MKQTYKKRDLFTVEEVTYNDGVVLFNIKGKNEDGVFSSGLYKDMDLIIQILELIGKIELKNVYISNKKE